MHIHSITTAGRDYAFRPFTGGGQDLRTATDPVNLLFVGEADALGIRAALKGLKRGRGPEWDDLANPTASWTDAVGGAQTAFAPSHGWSAGAVQLELGDFAGLRAHIRLFPYPGFVLGAAHLERLAPGSFEHTVFSWQGAEQLILSELERAGVLRAVTHHQLDLASPRRHSEVAVPEGLRVASALSPLGVVPGEPIPGWGSLAVATLAGLPRASTPGHLRWTRLTLDTPVSLPSIAAQSSVRIYGPVDIEHEVAVERGRFRARTRVRGDLLTDLAGRATATRVSEWQLARAGRGLGRIRSARRYLTGVPSADGPPSSHRVQTRLDRHHGPQVSVLAE